MNSMPEPTHTGDRINDSRTPAEKLLDDTRERWQHQYGTTGDDGGFAERFLERQRAARALSWAASPICLVNDAGFCATHEGVHPTAEELVAMRRDDCPDWCTFDHRDDDERDDLVLHMGDEHTDGTVRRLLEAHGGSKLDVRVARTDCPPERRTGTPALMVRCDLELTTWEQAAELARTILDGFGYLKGAEKP